ncbi:hypothetical protein LB505_002746 [Fusarium chuoi]|nr:hypothetical protein LB505_002746 [Fusarium chuoi]
MNVVAWVAVWPQVAEKTVRHVLKPRATAELEKHYTETPYGLCFITPERLASVLYVAEKAQH